MPTREEIVQEYQKYFPDRQVSEGDIANAEKSGLGIVKNTYEQITKPMTNEQPLVTSGGQGQAASTGSLYDQESALREERQALTSGSNVFLNLLEKATEAKRQAQMPLQKREKKLKKQLMGVSPQDYEGMRPGDALEAMRGDYQNIRSELSEIENVRNEALLREQNYISGIRSMLEDQLTQMGLRIEDLGFQRAVEQQDFENQMALRAEARSGRGGGGGTPSYQFKTLPSGEYGVYDPSTGQFVVTGESQRLPVGVPTFDEYYAQVQATSPYSVDPNSIYPEYQAALREYQAQSSQSPLSALFGQSLPSTDPFSSIGQQGGEQPTNEFDISLDNSEF